MNDPKAKRKDDSLYEISLYQSRSCERYLAETFLASLALTKTNKESTFSSDITSWPDGSAKNKITFKNWTPCSSPKSYVYGKDTHTPYYNHIHRKYESVQPLFQTMVYQYNIIIDISESNRSNNLNLQLQDYINMICKYR